MRPSLLKSLFVMLVLAFGASTFAQAQQGQQAAQVAALTPDQAALLDAADSPQALQQAVAALVQQGVQPAAVAGALSQRGQTAAQVTATLVQAQVPPAQATVAVRSAVPGATNAQLQAGLTAANVPAAQRNAAVQAVAAAGLPVIAVPQAQAPATVATVTGAGLLVGQDGQAVTVRSQQDQLRAVVAFVQATLSNDPDSLSNPAVVSGLNAVINNARNAPGVSASMLNQAASQIQDALTQAGGGGGGGNPSGGLNLPSPTPTPTPVPTPTPYLA